MPRTPPRNLGALLTDIYRRPQVYFPALGKGPAGRTAQAATYLNYGPQFDALNAILGTARQTRRTGVQSARRSGLAGSQGIQKIRDSYLEGLGDALGTLGGPVASGAPVSSPEQRAAQQLGLSGTALAGMLSGQAAQQVAGITNQKAQLNRQFSSQRDEVARTVQSLFGQAGAYNTQQFQTLAGQQREARQAAIEAEARLRKDLMVAGINPDTGRYDPSLDAPAKPKEDPVNEYGVRKSVWESMSPAQRAKTAREWKEATSTGDSKPKPTLPGGVPFNTQQQHNSLRSDVLGAKHWASMLLPKFVERYGRDGARKALAQVLLSGGKSGDVKIPAFDPDITTYALDLAMLGHISRGSSKRLHSQGYGVKKLGFKTFTEATKKKPLGEAVLDAINPFGG